MKTPPPKKAEQTLSKHLEAYLLELPVVPLCAERAFRRQEVDRAFDEEVEAWAL